MIGIYNNVLNEFEHILNDKKDDMNNKEVKVRTVLIEVGKMKEFICLDFSKCGKKMKFKLYQLKQFLNLIGVWIHAKKLIVYEKEFPVDKFKKYG